jgi:arabinogalactan oligomer/maltooligosaccharide transport system permease protein
MFSSLTEVVGFVVLVTFAALVLDAFIYLHFRFFRFWWLMAALPLALAGSIAAVAWNLGADGETSAFWGGIALVAEGLFALLSVRYIRGKHLLPALLLAPAVVGILALILYPLLFEVRLAFFDLKLTTMREWVATGSLPFVGLTHFKNVFLTSPLSEITFWQLLGRTALWTFSNVFCHVVGGFILALLLNNNIRLKGLYRALIIVPWAMPQVVAVLAMRGEFHAQYGFINVMLARLGIAPVQWLSHHALLTCTIINVWLGIPFMMVVILGGLQSIPRSYYDAAAIDGANALQRFRLITLPLIRPVLAPAVTLGTIWTFNNINVIYLVTGQEGGSEDADILVSALYKAAFSFSRYSYSAAFALVLFVILLTVSVLWLKFSKGTESVYE